MKKLLLSATVVAGLFAAPTVESLQKQIELLQKQLNELKANQKKVAKKVEEQNDRYYKKVAPVVSNTHLFLSTDLRTSFDFVSQKTKSGKTYTNNILSNRVIITGIAKPADNLKFNLKVEANSMFGMNNSNKNSQYNNISWVANETPDDTNIRIKEAYFNYWFGKDNGYMFSAGRRPATNGYPANLREGDRAESPIAHLVNMEFDGFSFLITNTAMSDWSDKFNDWGTSLKFCVGRGYSSSEGKWPKGSYAYAKDDKKITDFGGFILVPYDDGQYAVWMENIWAWNMQGYTSNQLDTLGNYFGTNILFKADGIGDGISDFLDDTKAFVSFALSRTNPDGGKQMLGSTDSKTGSSVWIGADMPGVGDNDRWGVSFVRGSKYWRSMTYGEDTLVGSIAAVRGKAFDIYYIKQIIPHLTTSLRATYLDYDHAGSDAFFGEGGNPDQSDYVKKATDIRAYIRYNF
ncbi:FIG01209174: hypothetical protein [hydrothermal vent metagenome]|uniref:DUF3373 domain-containing protein n=1 Tax=hydrothermal vent metagenome TaxID=652676 RepID=A0A1W1C079_9ZZZZ